MRRPRPLILSFSTAIFSLAVSCPFISYGGDILRGGAVSVGNRVPDGRGATPAQAAELRSNASDTLARTNQAINSVRNMQAAARAAARNQTNAGTVPGNPALNLPNVPDGLAPGGLQVATGAVLGGPLWRGADLPVQSTSAGGVDVTIKQRASQAFLTWDKFNVGSRTHLRFDQSAGGNDASKWIAFNDVKDPTGEPSQILGRISAEGQVYVINQNGIIFGGASQINTHTFVASTLPINYNLVNRGLLNQTSKAQFLFSALAQEGDVPFTPPDAPTSGRIGDITVRAGAILGAPTNAANVGGRVALIGANVSNAGSILTPDGQAILAAGLQVGFDGHPSSDPSLRGLDTYVGQVGTYAGRVENTGLIETLRGNATLTGREVVNKGAINSSTSVAVNGRIDLRAEFNAIASQKYEPITNRTAKPFLYGGIAGVPNTGTVTLGEGSLLRVLPEYGSPDKVAGVELGLKSQVNLRGKIVHAQPSATILAPSGNVKVQAGTYDFDSSSNTDQFIRQGGQIYLDKDSVINVAGTPGASSPLSNWILKVTLRGSELADAPIQRDNPLIRGQEITVDLRKTGTYNGQEWIGTPLADLRGYLNLVERTVEELTVKGGSVTLQSGGSVISQRGSIIDTSAGYYNVGSGQVQTTRLLYYGRLFDIADATPDRLYQGIYTGLFKDVHPNWGITHTYKVPWMTGEHYERPYLHGADGGLLAIAAASVALDGTYLGKALSGPRQYNNPSRGSTFDLAFETERLEPGSAVDPVVSPTPPTVTFSYDRPNPAGPFGVNASGDANPLREDRVRRVILNPDLLAQGGGGFGSIRVRNPDGDIIVPAGITLAAQPKGTITLQGANVRVDGTLSAPGGSLNFAAYNISPSISEYLDPAVPRPPAAPNRGNFVLGSSASLNTSGLVIDQRTVDNPTFRLPQVIDGGNVSIRSYSANLSGGSSIDVSGGAIANPRGGIQYGRAGAIEILTGADPILDGVTGGKLHLGSTLKGYSGTTTGGSISIQAQLIQIGGNSPHPLALVLRPEFFSEGGFSKYLLKGLGALKPGGGPEEYLPAVSVADGTIVRPQVKSWLGIPFASPDGTLQLIPFEKPEAYRGPASITLSAPGVLNASDLVYRGDIRIGRGARIETDGLGTLALEGQTVSVFGSLIAPGGRISLRGANSFPEGVADRPQATVYLAPGSLLSTAGKTITYRDRFGNTVGTVLPGGAVSVSGNIIAERGAVIDVSGTSGLIEAHPLQLGLDAEGNPLVYGQPLVHLNSGLTSPLYASLGRPTWIDSAGGSISLTGGQMLFTDATLRGFSGGGDALGGSLSISSGRFRPTATGNTAETNLVVTQSGFTLPSSFSNLARGGIGQSVLAADGTSVPGMGYFTADRFTQGGFSSLSLGGNVEFKGPVTINAENALLVGTGGVIRANGPVNLSAFYAGLGRPFSPPTAPGSTPEYFVSLPGNETFNFAPTYGPGVLNVTAQHIDMGLLSLDGIGKANFTATNGDIRGNGFFQMAGDLTLKAAQVYPTTDSPFQLFVYDGGGKPGSITIQGSGVKHLPLSAAGTLGLYASTITQNGTLRAPFGQINLGWDGTGTAPVANPMAGAAVAVPTTSTLTLGAGSVTSIAAIDPITGQGVNIPYGIVQGGDKWIGPSGLDITALGPPEKRLILSAKNINAQTGSTLDIRGGGDLFAYRFVPGTGGSTDILGKSNVFAILPGYDSLVSPYGPYSASSVFGEDTGYFNGGLRPGNQIYLTGGPQFAGGYYTLLPARYALLPGAYLVSPQSGGPVGYFPKPDGSYLVQGYRFNLQDPGTESILHTRWEVAPGKVIRNRAQYDTFSGNQFLAEAAISLNQAIPRLPQDSGRLLLQASTGLQMTGSILGKPLGEGRGALVDINSPLDIYIGRSAASAPVDALFLSSSQLSGIGAESLLIGGTRNAGQVTVSTGNVTLDNFGTTVRGNDIILVAKDSLTLAEGASLQGTAGGGAAEPLRLGNATSGSGNAMLVRVSGDPNASVTRTGVRSGQPGLLTVADDVKLSGGSIYLDSTSGTNLSDSAVFSSQTLNLASGQVSILLDNPGSLVSTGSLTLSGNTLATLGQNIQNLNLASYTALDIYGTGSLSIPGALGLNVGEIRGFNQNGGTVNLSSSSILVQNTTNASALGAVAAATGYLNLNADRISLGTGNVPITQFLGLGLNATQALQLTGKGQLNFSGDLTSTTPAIISGKGADYLISSTGALSFLKPGAASTIPESALGGKLALVGSSVTLNSDIIFPSGLVSATATAGPVTIAGQISTAGIQRNFNNVARYTDGGRIELNSVTNNVILTASGILDVSAPTGGGDAGTLQIKAANGIADLQGQYLGTAANGTDGKFGLDVSVLPTTSGLASKLASGGFTEAVNLRVRTGNVLVDGTMKAQQFSLATDAGSITVAGTINSSGVTGGSIQLIANRDVTLNTGSQLLAKGDVFNAAGKGGSISLQAGSQVNGVVPTGAQLNLQSGSIIDLGVAEYVAGGATVPGSSAFNGEFNGVLHLRAPQTADAKDLALAPILADIRNASAIQVEGYRLFDLTSTTGTITAAVQTQVRDNGTTFGNNATNMLNRILAGGAANPLAGSTVFSPGAEIIHRTGNLSLGTTTSTASSDWNLAGNRFGANLAPGVLTLRAAGDLVFYNSLSDGFSGGSNLWLAPLMEQNALLPVNLQTYSFNLAAGSDFTSTNANSVLQQSLLPSGRGSLLLGKQYNYSDLLVTSANAGNALTATALNNSNRLQLIRTGSGNINISAGRDVQILNPFASIYTAGTRVANPTTLFTPGDFELPKLTGSINNVNTTLGRSQQDYPAQYAMAGGNIAIQAGGDIARYTKGLDGLIDDASKQIPGNWLYRRGYIDPMGNFGQTGVSSGTSSLIDPRASTTWWVDYSNFFQSVGALGGGNVRMQAGGNVSNVDAVSATNARAAAGRPDAGRFLELGGGDVLVRSEANIYGGTYYVERGNLDLEAGGSITLRESKLGSISGYNPRSPSLGLITGVATPTITDASTWIPTMAFLGRGNASFSAGNDILMGPVSNAFLNPGGIGNKYWYKTYFSTFGENNTVTVNSLSGDITHRLAVTLPKGVAPVTTLQAWLESQHSFSTTGAEVSAGKQPWLRILEPSITPFTYATQLQPATFRSTTFDGDISIVGPLTLSPASRGNLELSSSGNLIGLGLTGYSSLRVAGSNVPIYTAARINVSDASPSEIPSILNPNAYFEYTPKNATTGLTGASGAASGGLQFNASFDKLFNESGSLTGGFAATQTKQALHDSEVLHTGDTNPLKLLALGGDISGFTVFSPKASQIVAQQDITDVALYLQNISSTDGSIIASGRDIIPYNPNSSLRSTMTAQGGFLPTNESSLVGDIQIGGPGNLSILAGRKFSLGSTPLQGDGTGDGISSIGNLKNPFLSSSTGANITLAAGIGPSTSLNNSKIDFEAFISQYVKGGEGPKYLAELGVTNFDALSVEEQAKVAMDVFYKVLRDAGRNFATAGNYDAGTQAIETLFGSVSGNTGSIDLSSRALKTRANGSISIAAPSGGLTLGSSIGVGGAPPGIITEAGGGINIFTKEDVDVGVLRIFTLRGGDIMIWSSEGDVAAGSSSKTVAAAPPTRVVIDSQSADVATDLAGLSTGGGIGVLATVKNLPPGNVDLVAPNGAVDAGDAGIRSSGNLTIAAATVLNAGNIAVSGSSVGAPAAAAPSAPSVSAPPAPTPTQTKPPTETANDVSSKAVEKITQATEQQMEQPLSDFEVKVMKYGGAVEPETNDSSTVDDEERKRKQREAEKMQQNPQTEVQ